MIKRHPWGGLAEPGLEPPHDVVILGLPYDGGASWRGGAAEAPRRLRDISSTSAAIAEDGSVVDPSRLRIHDAGDIAAGPDGRSEEGRKDYFRRVEETSTRLLGGAGAGHDPFLMSIGGDHSVSIPLLRAFGARHSDGFGIVLLDAHPDLFDTYEGSALSHACPMRRALEAGRVRPEHLVVLGTRSYNQVEITFMKEKGIRFVPARAIDRSGLEATLDLTRQRLAGVTNVYLSIDIDVADPSCAPGTGYPVAGGLSSRQLLDLTRGLVEHLPIRAMDLVEVSPPLDPAGITLFLALQIVFETFAVLAARPR